MLPFVTLFYSVYVIFFHILPDFSANIFLFTLSRLQTIYFIFSDRADSFFSIFLTPPPPKENNGLSLRVSCTYLNCGLINEITLPHRFVGSSCRAVFHYLTWQANWELRDGLKLECFQKCFNFSDLIWLLEKKWSRPLQVWIERQHFREVV